MSKDWRDEVRDILKREGFEPSGQGKKPERRPPRRAPQRGNWLDTLGGWVRRRFASTNEMLVTAASLVVIALILYATPMKQVAAILAVAGGITFLLAIGRGILDRRRGTGTGPVGQSSPAMWRGQVIDIDEHRPNATLGDRVRAWWRRRR